VKRIFLLVAIASAAAISAAAADPIRVMILTGQSDYSHPWRPTVPFMREMLDNTGRFDVRVEEEVRGITSATLATYDVLVDYYYGPRLGDATEKAIEDFVRAGKGMVGVHGVDYGPFFGQAGGNPQEPKRRMEGEPWPAFPEMLGMNWKIENIGHTRRHAYPVQWSDREHPIAKGLPPVFMANDELHHRIDLKPNAHVIATAYDDPAIPGGGGGTGKDEPVIWTVPFGQGRVVMTVLGHDLLAMTQQGFIEAFARSVEWAASGDVKASAVKPPTPAQ
jgi:type 1 glutamine amidotransferase